MKCGTFKTKNFDARVTVFGRVWEYVAGCSFIAVRMSPKSLNFSPEFSFVMNRKSDDIAFDVKREIERRFPQLAGVADG